MKRSPIADRVTPLRRVTALNVSPPARSSVRARQSNTPNRRGTSSSIPAKVRTALARRSGGVCEVQAPGCVGRAVDPSHRKKTGAGGRHGDAAVRHHVLSNLLHACRPCNSEAIHAMPTAAYWRGWMLREGENPAGTKVLYRGRWSLLGDDGSVTPTEVA